MVRARSLRSHKSRSGRGLLARWSSGNTSESFTTEVDRLCVAVALCRCVANSRLLSCNQESPLSAKWVHAVRMCVHTVGAILRRIGPHRLLQAGIYMCTYPLSVGPHSLLHSEGHQTIRTAREGQNHSTGGQNRRHASTQQGHRAAACMSFSPWSFPWAAGPHTDGKRVRSNEFSLSIVTCTYVRTH